MAIIFARNDIVTTEGGVTGGCMASKLLNEAIAQAVRAKPGLRKLQRELGPKRLELILSARTGEGKKKYKTLTFPIIITKNGASLDNVYLEAVIKEIGDESWGMKKVTVKLLFPGLSGEGHEIRELLGEVFVKYELAEAKIEENGFLVNIFLSGENLPVILNGNGRAHYNPLCIVWGTKAELKNNKYEYL